MHPKTHTQISKQILIACRENWYVRVCVFVCVGLDEAKRLTDPKGGAKVVTSSLTHYANTL